MKPFSKINEIQHANITMLKFSEIRKKKFTQNKRNPAVKLDIKNKYETFSRNKYALDIQFVTFEELLV